MKNQFVIPDLANRMRHLIDSYKFNCFNFHSGYKYLIIPHEGKYAVFHRTCGRLQSCYCSLRMKRRKSFTPNPIPYSC